MPSRANDFVSSSSRPLPLRMRPDLSAERHSYQGRLYWVIKDPIALKYYRFEEEEFQILQMLDGRANLDDLQRRFEEMFAPQRIALTELQHFLGMMHRSGLLAADGPGQGTQLLARGRARRRREHLAALTNVLSIRFKGFDPDRLLNVLDRRIGWAFSLPAVVCGLLLAAAALLLVAVQFEVFCSRLPEFSQFFASQNWIWLAVTMAVAKVLHEFGHGLACKRCRGECHEMGVLLLALMPCLYCDVSDSWMLPDKWRRAAIAAAGMYVEIVLAAVCTFVWWFSEPGLLNYVCLNVMFVSSVSTVVFNANPLLRYDGYYILSDLVEIPNLRQKASAILRRKLGAWLFGLPEPHDPFLPQRRQSLLALYAIAAAVYRWVVVFSILWFVYHMFEPYGLKIAGQAIACVALYGLFIQPVWSLLKLVRTPTRRFKVKKPRALVSLSAAAVIVLAALCVPLPHRVECGLHVQPRDAAAVYVDTPGMLTKVLVRGGQRVQLNQPLISLENLDLQIASAQLEGQRQQLAARLRGLHQSWLRDPAAADQIEQVSQSLQSVEEQLAQRRGDLKRLEVAAPAAGIVVEPPELPRPEADADRLPTWSGTPLDAQNRGALIGEGSLVCQIAQPGRYEAILAIDQADTEFVASGQPVDLFFDQFPGGKVRSQVEHISQLDMKVAPLSFSQKSGGAVATRTDATGNERPISTTYLASCPFDDAELPIVIGARGRAKIHTGYQTLGQRAWRYVAQTFHFEL